MPSAAFHLIVLRDGVTEASFVSTVGDLALSDRPLYIGKCQHWIHPPHLSTAALTGSGNTIKGWGYLLVTKPAEPTPIALPDALMSLLESNWSIVADQDYIPLDNYAEAQRIRLAATAPQLPEGWSPSDHRGLDAATPPADLEASLALSSYPLGSRSDTGQKPVVLKDFARDFGSRHTGPISMFNLLSYLPDQRSRYFEYIAAFQASVGSRYGGDAQFFGLGVSDWSSKSVEASTSDGDETGGPVGWEDVGLVFYPSLWHFCRMLDDPDYMDVDRRFKQGVLRDNPILCCTEVGLGV